MSDHAFKSTHSDVLAAWRTITEQREAIGEKRREMQERFGRPLMVSGGWGHSQRVRGFAPDDDDVRGELAADGALRWLKSDNFLSPNTRRKAGKDLAAEVGALGFESIDLPGSPAFHLGGGEAFGIRMHSPELFEHDGAIWARWGCEIELGDQWEPVPLSAFYAAKEAKA